METTTWSLPAAFAFALLGACSADSSGALGSSSSSGSSSGGSTGPWPDASVIDAAPDAAGPTASSDAGGPPPTFDSYHVFATVIEPILDTAGGTGCTNTSCHGAAAGIGGLALTQTPTPGTAQMKANFAAISALCNFLVPDQSIFYTQATNNHGGIAVSQAQGTQILDWITHTANVTPPPADAGTGTGTGSDAGATGGGDAGGGTVNGCPPGSPGADITGYLNLAYFSSEIQPILFGTVNYNQPPGTPVASDSCGRGACHGSPTNPLSLSPKNTAATNLHNFGCFVNLANPNASPILQCPLNANPALCTAPNGTHPGQNVFASQQDLNFQRIASWLYSAQPPASVTGGGKGAASPLDFAWYARNVGTIFDDPAFGGQGATGSRTCADTNACHGVTSVGQIPPNLSNFPILANAATKTQMLVNYATAAGFANVFTPQGSELFLFPTNTVADATQPYATGLAHPGGIDIGANSATAQQILTWAGGLRPDGNGNVLNWLVAGTYDVAQVTQSTAAGSEATLAPTIFDNANTQLNGGIWDLFASPSANVDLTQPFGQAGANRVAYAYANVINATGSAIQASVTVSSPNAVEVWVGSSIGLAQQNGNNVANAVGNFPSFSATKQTTRILVKVFQRAADNQFAFTLNLTNLTTNAPLTNTTGELVFRLDPTGGI
jgi:hypothetical protein